MVVLRWSSLRLASVALAVLLTPLASAAPEVRDPSEATVFVDGDADYLEFAPGAVVSAGTTWVITAPDGTTVTLTRTGTQESATVERWSLSGQRLSGTHGHWTWTGYLHGAAADGTWTILLLPGAYSAEETQPSPYYDRPFVLSVAGRTLSFSFGFDSAAGVVQTWNWHEGSWSEPNKGLYAVDPPGEHPAEDPQSSRYFATDAPPLPEGPFSQSLFGASESETVPAQDINTPGLTIPATCTLGPCEAETPLVTPAQPVAQTCVPPAVPLFCVGPFTVPAQDLGAAPAACDVAGAICVGPVPVASQHVAETNAVTVSLEFTGIDVFADPNAGETASIGPIVETVPVPLIGDVPVTVCPETCPFPVFADGETVGSLTITVTVGSEQRSVTVPLDSSV